MGLVDARAPGPRAPTALVARGVWATGDPVVYSRLMVGPRDDQTAALDRWLTRERAVVTVLVPPG